MPLSTYGVLKGTVIGHLRNADDDHYQILVQAGKTLHRIAEQSLRAEVEAAGFKLVGSADFLRNPNDPRTESSGKNSVPNDEFVLKFQKP